MSHPILNMMKIATLTVLMVFLTGSAFESVHASFTEATLDTDIVMTLDTLVPFDDEAEMFNSFLNVFIAAYIATEGNMEIVVLGHNTICISVPGEHKECFNDKTLSQHRD